MANSLKAYQKVFRTKDGKLITFRIPRESDVDLLLEFINNLADEDTFAVEYTLEVD